MLLYSLLRNIKVTSSKLFPPKIIYKLYLINNTSDKYCVLWLILITFQYRTNYLCPIGI